MGSCQCVNCGKPTHNTGHMICVLATVETVEVSTLQVLTTIEIAESLKITGHDVCVLATVEIVGSLQITNHEVCVLATMEIVGSLHITLS